jgi:hypothetical protein
MAYTSGTASDYKDLLARMVTFAAANGWVALESTATQIYLKGTGLAGLDEIYVGAVTYEDAPNNRYNWKMVGSWGYRAGRAFDKHPKSSQNNGVYCIGYFWNSPIPYWMVCTPRRIILCAKIGTTYQQIHLGLLTPPATDAQYPYPLFIGGSGSSLLLNTSDTLFAFWADNSYSYSRLSFPGGMWGTQYPGGDYTGNPVFSAKSFNLLNVNKMVTALDGTYLLEPIYMVSDTLKSILGQIDGLYRVTGFNNAAENIITVSGVNYIVFPDGSRSGYDDYCAMRMS